MKIEIGSSACQCQPSSNSHPTHAMPCEKSGLEELCSDRKAQGKNLKDRLKALQGAVVIPQELLDAADEIRILGNNAAHVEAKEYDEIGREEAAAGIELAKELLKAVYQYAALVSRLRSLKKP